MPARLATSQDRLVDLGAPEITRDHLFGEVAHALACTNRFGGHTPQPYSVAQHSVMGADAILRETGNVELAAFFLLHDGHEAYLEDWTSPSFAALLAQLRADAIAAGVPPHVAAAFPARTKLARANAKRNFDTAIVEAAGLSFARFEAQTTAIHAADMRMLRTEADSFFPTLRAAFGAEVEHAVPFILRPARWKCWAWPEAEERFLDALTRLCPLTTPAPVAGARQLA